MLIDFFTAKTQGRQGPPRISSPPLATSRLCGEKMDLNLSTAVSP